MGYEIQVARCKMQVARCKSQVARCKSHVASRKSLSWCGYVVRASSYISSKHGLKVRASKNHTLQHNFLIFNP